MCVVIIHVYMIQIIYCIAIQNISESDPRSYEATKADVATKTQTKF